MNPMSMPSQSNNIFKDFKYYSFYKAVEQLELNYTTEPLGQSLDPNDEKIRFGVRPGLGFPATDIVSLEKYDHKVFMEIAFLGLIGPSGVLPTWYNELAIEADLKISEIVQKLNSDDKSEPTHASTLISKNERIVRRLKRVKNYHSSLTNFFNIFHHRLIIFYYLAWKKTKLPGFNQQIDSHLLSLTGLNSKSMLHILDIMPGTFQYRTGLLSKNVPSAKSLEMILSSFTSTQVHIKQFVERKMPIPENELTIVGDSTFKLGKNTLCGKRYWECQSLIRITFGPMNYNRFLMYFPKGNMHKTLLKLIQLTLGPEFEFEIVLILNRKQVPIFKAGPSELKLGYNTWIKNEQSLKDPFLAFSAQYTNNIIKESR